MAVTMMPSLAYCSGRSRSSYAIIDLEPCSGVSRKGLQQCVWVGLGPALEVGDDPIRHCGVGLRHVLGAVVPL